MTSQQFLVCDSSTLANFKQWAQAISGFFATAGWVQTSDTGQVNWSTISTVPGSGAFVYEIWKPGDALTVFYVKMEYGNQGAANSPGLRVSIGTGTNGAGTLTGFFFGPNLTNGAAITIPSSSTQFECDFSGDAGRISVMMWRNSTTGNSQQFFSIERSVNASGAWTGTYVTLWTCGYYANINNNPCSQQTLIFGVGAAPPSTSGGGSNNVGGWQVRSVTNGSFNGTIPFDTAAPCIGYFDYPCTTVGCGATGDFTEGVTFTVSVYGATRTYMPSHNGQFGASAQRQTAGSLCMRYD